MSSLVSGPRRLAVLVRHGWAEVLFPGGDVVQRGGGTAFWGCFTFVAVVAGTILFLNLSYPLIEPDEGRYAEIGREMLTSGDWLVPQLHHEPFYDKPPLFFWLVAASFRVLGTHEWVARLIPATATLFAVLATFWFGARVFGTRAGLISACILILSVGYIALGRVIILDSLLASLVAISLFTAYEAVRNRPLNSGWWLASAAACALAVMAKGPVAVVLLVGPVVVLAWLHSSVARPSLRNWFIYLSIVAAVTIPWYVAVILRDPHFAYHFFIEHHIARFFTAEFHQEPVWFYVPVLVGGILPWSFLFPYFIRFVGTRPAEIRRLRTRALGFILLWASWVFVFFSLSTCKLASYMLPAGPPVALMLGYLVDCALFQPEASRVLSYTRGRLAYWIVAVVAGTAFALNGWLWYAGPPASRSQAWAIPGAVLPVLVASAMIWCRRHIRPQHAWSVCGVLCFLVILESTAILVPAWSNDRSPLAGDDDVEKQFRQGGVGVAWIGEMWGSIRFRLNDDQATFCANAQPRERLTEFLTRYPRSFFITKPEIDENLAQALVGPGLHLERRTASTRAVIYAVEPVPAGPR